MRVAVVLVLAVLCQLAHANPPGMTEPAPLGLTPSAPEVTPQPPAPPLKSYRSHVLIADGIAVGLMVLAVEQNDDSSEALAKLSLGTYVFGAPLVHLTKNKSGRALASITMRVGFPIIGAMLGRSMAADQYCDYNYEYNCGDAWNSDEAAMGILAGIIGAMVVDAAYLAKGDPPKQQAGWAPTAGVSHGGVVLGAAGRF
jgi:hypothetical protein